MVVETLPTWPGSWPLASSSQCRVRSAIVLTWATRSSLPDVSSKLVGGFVTWKTRLRGTATYACVARLR